MINFGLLWKVDKVLVVVFFGNCCVFVRMLNKVFWVILLDWWVSFINKFFCIFIFWIVVKVFESILKFGVFRCFIIFISIWFI